MRRHEEREYHVARARAELDAAYRAAGSGSASTHLRLFTIHVEQAAGLEQADAAAAPPELDWLRRVGPFHLRCLA